MPEFTLNLTQKAVTKLQALVDRHNANQGTDLTLLAWLQLHAQELAIAADLNAAVTELQRQANDDANTALQTAITTARDQLLATL